MIRSVTVIRFRPGTRPEQIDAFARAIEGLEIEGMASCTMGRDLRLRDTAADFAMVHDFEDEAAYRRYQHHPDHEAVRRGIGAEIIESGAISQFELR